MTIASHIARSLAPVLTDEKEQFNLFFYSGDARSRQNDFGEICIYGFILR